MKRKPNFYFLLGDKIVKYDHCAEGTCFYGASGPILSPRGRNMYHTATSDGTPITADSTVFYDSISEYQAYWLGKWREAAQCAGKTKVLIRGSSVMTPLAFEVGTSTWRQRCKFTIVALDSRGSMHLIKEALTKPQAYALAKDLNQQLKEIWK